LARIRLARIRLAPIDRRLALATAGRRAGRNASGRRSTVSAALGRSGGRGLGHSRPRRVRLRRRCRRCGIRRLRRGGLGTLLLEQALALAHLATRELRFLRRRHSTLR
jgi:hypothetical protein